jgi:S-DNA-T family DNA segregation ATPase FtsK/SpoIIIE
MAKTTRTRSSGPAGKSARSGERRRQLRFTFGARGREIAGVLLIALAILSLLALSYITSGSLADGWSKWLYHLFGWGAFGAVALMGGLGVLLIWLAQDMGRPTPWRMIISLEVAFLSLLGALHAYAAGDNLWQIMENGEGGGVFGWALVTLAAPMVGRAWAGAIFASLTLIGLTIAFVIPWSMWTRSIVARIRAISIDTADRSGAENQSVVDEPPLIPAETEDIVPPKEIIIKGGKLDQAPLTATQLPLKVAAVEKRKKIKRDRNLPPLDLLEDHTLLTITETEIERKSEVIEETLRQFGLEVKVVRVSQGPAVTQFGVEPGFVERPGLDGEVRRQKVRVSQISSLSNDLALALMAPSLRIEAPVPGQSFVGIEVPNDKIDMVGLRGVLDSTAFRKVSSPLAFALGKDVSGAAVAADLASMPHILIAGTTGSGKSVCINAIVMSLIANNMPEDLRLVMIDPKMVELIRYNGLPHLYGKVETELERIVTVLRWVTREMDARYKKFAELGARHFTEFNLLMLDKGEEKLPYIAVMIDELADLMMSAPVEIEKTITRIAQMARATGIHLVVATQRPSTDVITGLIKANFPARIAFSVASGVDSRVILDSVGAETLLGKGDMLFQSPTAGTPQRIQGCYVGEREIDKVVEFWRAKYADEESQPAPWEMSKVQQLGEIAQSSVSTAALEDGDEVLLAKAIEVVKKHRSASASLLQRKLSLGFPKAAALLDEMEKMGVVGPAQQAGRTRIVLIGGESDEGEEQWG